jgi:glycosyltransferase involved in cell wall biosynthesis
VKVQDCNIVFECGEMARRVSVIVPLYNYAHFIEATLDSVVAQTERDVALIVIDDCSSDASVPTVATWMERQGNDGIGLRLCRNQTNARLSITRNTGIAQAQSPYCFMLDADNLLYPRCIEKHAAALDDRPEADAAYSLIEVFEGDTDVMGAGVFCREGFRHGNFVDAMAMIRTNILNELKGYTDIRHGWEDYDLWLRMVEADRTVLHIPEILSRYRQHQSSMLRTQTNVARNIRELHRDMTQRHPWLALH